MGGVDLRYEPNVGLALGGGGALGAAHAGVLEVLHERGIHPTIVVGTSAGAIAGGAYANGFDPYEFSNLVRRARWGDFGTFSMTPGLGLLDTEGLRATVEEMSHDVRIEDMPVRFAAIATDAITNELVVIDKGSLVDAVSASIAVPGLFRPKRLEGRTLVDGGVVQNLPLEVAFEMGATHVIGVRLAPEWDLLPKGRTTSLQVHEYEIRDDVTMITPKLRHRSQWVVKDLPGLIELGREAAEFALSDYPVVHSRPEFADAEGDPPVPSDSDPSFDDLVRPQREAQRVPGQPRGVAAFFQRR